MKIRSITAAGLAASVALLASFAQAQMSRDEVKQELIEAKAGKMLVQNGEMAEPDEVLAARDAFNVRQADQIAALTAQRLAEWAAYEEAERQRLAWLREQEQVALAQQPPSESTIATEPTPVRP